MKDYDSLESIKQSIDSNNMVLIYFGNKTCGVCTDLKPKVEEMLKEFPKIKSIYVDVDKSNNIAVSYNFFTVPAILVFVEGKITIREAGYISVRDLSNKITRYYKLLEL
ncbi:thioredoxin family protein [Anaerocolumna sp.]|uniref:thioredoxin family protein n=1 Tax=Anaerocolumna sp. TaxID=2041569 RepID=UPI0028AFCA01|nr:thioredoxin family protein [Anaerocolumna sp.]